MQARYALLLALAGSASQAPAQETVMPLISVNGGRPSSLPTQIPTTIESITGEQIRTSINATDSEDALKYFPSLNVRKRFAGDYDHAVLASRASGTGNSARSLVYADGILLSNLLGNGATSAPRWGMVSPEEIDRVDVLYGPFSAAYPGNSAGAVVDFQTRMPSRLEFHAKVGASSQAFKQYASDGQFGARQGSVAVGNRTGGLSWWFDAARLDSKGQPLSYANKLVSTGVVSSAGLPVHGAVADKNPANRDWLIIGATGQSDTVQDNAKIKLAYDFSEHLRASYTLGWWGNDARRGSESYLRDAAGQPVYRGDANNFINIDGKRYELRAADLAPTIGKLSHHMHGLSLKRHAMREWNWEIAASKVAYAADLVRTPTVNVAGLDGAGRGNLSSLKGSGWQTFAAKGIFRPDEEHVVDLGYQDDGAHLRSRVDSSADWIHGAPASMLSIFNGNTKLQSIYAQDTWRFADDWKGTFGLRGERWRAFGGEIATAASKVALPFKARSESAWSPKAALQWQAGEEWTFKASLGRAVRNPTASELFQGSVVDLAIVNSDPNLRAEKSWTGEVTAERAYGDNVLRLTSFHELTRDALYSQPLTSTVNTVQNVGRIRTNGIEVASQMERVLVEGLSINSSLTFADSIITENRALPASEGKWQPRVPRWRANVLAAYRAGDQWSASIGVRYSGRQYSALDNSDTHGETFTGVSDYMVADVRLRYKFDKNWSMAVGVDNLNNAKYWAFHPYTMRSCSAELRFDL